MKRKPYGLYVNGYGLARYATLGQALLGALWRSRKVGSRVYVMRGPACVAVVCDPRSLPPG